MGNLLSIAGDSSYTSMPSGGKMNDFKTLYCKVWDDQVAYKKGYKILEHVLIWTSLNRFPVIPTRCHQRGRVSQRGGVSERRVGYPRGVGYPGGVPYLSHDSCDGPTYPPLTDTCEKITFPQLRWRAVNIILWLYSVWHLRRKKLCIIWPDPVVVDKGRSGVSILDTFPRN